MLERIAKKAEREASGESLEPVEKPWWWVALSGAIGLVLAGVSLFLGYQHLGELPNEVGPLCAFIGGTAAFYGVSGWKAGNYENFRTGDKKVLWTKMGLGMRLLITAASIFLLGVGFTAMFWAGTMF